MSNRFYACPLLKTTSHLMLPTPTLVKVLVYQPSQEQLHFPIHLVYLTLKEHISA